MNIEFDVYKQKLNDCRPALEGLADSLNVEGLRNELERLHAMQEAPGFWDDPEKSQKIVVKTKQAENKVERYENMCASRMACRRSSSLRRPSTFRESARPSRAGRQSFSFCL